ncbi:unnamed protein product [Miscanthus lutarioriparius]|uniref:snRNA-activating protein complex subunit n=1 Tax=Miscanthus lutarioriparius TaxID=422564 RepID=A0A811NUS9_9POAL|nr:unnamed protein product [Miscanthus lutarioriparius]
MAGDGEGAESSAAGERQGVPFALGGPVFVPFMVGPISTVPEFMSSALHELQALEDELGDPGDEFDDELCVDELKVLSEEELVERALQEAMEDSDSGTQPQSEDQTLDGGMSANPTPTNEALTLSPSAERESSGLPVEDVAAVLNESQSSNSKPRGTKAKARCRKGKTGTVTLDSPVEGESHGSAVDMSIVPFEPERSEGNGTTPSNPSAENGVSESPVDGMSIVPHDLEGTNGQTTCRKGKKRGRHFDREVRAEILQGSYLTKAEKWVQIKAKQDEDKFTARLHSFSGNSVKPKGSKSSSEKIEMARSLKLIGAPWKNKALRSDKHRPVVHPEVILCVEIYQKTYASVKSQELLVLGSQFLTDLRDNICCLTDKLMKVAGQHDHSGYFLIEDTFYNDTRHYSATDYSKPILDWLENSSDEVAEKWDAITSGVLKKRQKDLLSGLSISNVPEFKSEKMQMTRFSNLHFRPGAAYLYCHQGNCKHTIVIRDMRLIHPDDTQNQAEYPLQTFQLQKRLQKCSVCQIYLATKVTVDDKWALNNPCYFCIKCYYLLHYKEDSTLLYPHTVYDFIQE